MQPKPTVKPPPIPGIPLPAPEWICTAEGGRGHGMIRWWCRHAFQLFFDPSFSFLLRKDLRGVQALRELVSHLNIQQFELESVNARV